MQHYKGSTIFGSDNAVRYQNTNELIQRYIQLDSDARDTVESGYNQNQKKKKLHRGMGRTTIKSRKGREETQTITTDKTENEWTRNINNSDEQEGTQNGTDKHRATYTYQYHTMLPHGVLSRAVSLT